MCMYEHRGISTKSCDQAVFSLLWKCSVARELTKTIIIQKGVGGEKNWGDLVVTTFIHFSRLESFMLVTPATMRAKNIKFAGKINKSVSKSEEC